MVFRSIFTPLKIKEDSTEMSGDLDKTGGRITLNI